MGDFRHDKINEKLIRHKDKFSVAGELVDTESKLAKAHDEIDLTYCALKEVFGSYGVDRIKARIKEIKDER